MATRPQSLRPSACLGPNCRPPMSGHSLSGLSTMTLASSASSQSDEEPEEPSTRPTSPSRPSTLPTTPSRPPTSVEDELSSAEKGGGPTSHGAVVSAPASNASLSRPIAIQVPPMKKYSSAPDCTPPEPLSARGDLIGGYFPMHEDPRVRVRQTHPFTHTAATGRPSQCQVDVYPPPILGIPDDPACHVAPPNRYIPQLQEDLLASERAIYASGRYYPGNYEKRQKYKKLSQVSKTLTTRSRIPTAAPPSSIGSGGREIVRASSPPPRSKSADSFAASPRKPARALIRTPREPMTLTFESARDPATWATLPKPPTKPNPAPPPPLAPDESSLSEARRKRRELFKYQRSIHAQTITSMRRKGIHIYRPLPPAPVPSAPMPPSIAPPKPYVPPHSSRRGMDLPPREARVYRASLSGETRSRRERDRSPGILQEMIDLSLFEHSPWEPLPGQPMTLAQMEPRTAPAAPQAPPTSAPRDKDAKLEVIVEAASGDQRDQGPPNPASPVLNPMGLLGTITPLALDPLLSPGGILGGANAETLRCTPVP